jgi:hypothetical protein
VHHSYEYNPWLIPLGRKTHVTKAVSDELHVPEVDGFAIIQVVSVGDDNGFRWMNHWNVQSKACYKSPFLARQLSMFFALANNRVFNIKWFQFWGGLVVMVYDYIWE